MVKVNIVVRIKLSSKLKNITSEIGYYSYTKPYQQAKKTPLMSELLYNSLREIYPL
ncbi:MAG: hypothetical protein ACI8Q1_003186, partial [Parvicella sp.]